MALTDSLISYWKLDEASGDALDAHGSNTLADNNTVGSAAGKINNARDFESANTEGFTLADNASLSTGDIDFTITAWVNLEAKPAGPASVVAKGTATSGEYYVVYRGTGGSDRFEFDNYGSSGFGNEGLVLANSLGSPSAATWYFIVAWHDATANTVNIQVNNGTVDSTSHSAGVYDGTGTFSIGSGYPHSSLGELWDGLIDEVGFWKRVLTSDERTSLYNAGAGLAYPFSAGGHPAVKRGGGVKFMHGGHQHGSGRMIW